MAAHTKAICLVAVLVVVLAAVQAFPGPQSSGAVRPARAQEEKPDTTDLKAEGSAYGYGYGYGGPWGYGGYGGYGYGYPYGGFYGGYGGYGYGGYGGYGYGGYGYPFYG